MNPTDPRPWWECDPLTVAPGHELTDGRVLTFEATSACPCRDCRDAIAEVYGADWRTQLTPGVEPTR